MSTLYPVEPTKPANSVHDAWSLRRSAALVLAGGAIFWAIVIYFLVL